MQIKPIAESTQTLTMTAGTATGASRNVIKNLLNDKFLYGYDLVFKGRLAVGVAAASAVLPESPQSIFRRVRVEIQHKRFKKQAIIDLPGASLFERAKLFNRKAPHTFGTPPAVGVGNYDFGVVLPLRFALENVFEQQEFGTLLNGADCSSIQIFLDMAPAADLLTPAGTTTFTWTAYGSPTGSPTVDIIRKEVNGLSHNPVTDLVIKTDRVDGLNNAVALNNVNGLYLPRGADMRLIGLKQYVASPNGEDVVSSFLNPVVSSDNGLAVPQLLIGKKAIRDHSGWQDLVAETADHYGITPDTGYGVWDFVNRGDRWDALAASVFAKNQNQYGYGGKINPAGATAQIEVFYDQILSASDQGNA